MAKINVLDSSIYNRIAAGEVVERPASVVKELVENSIDAGATSIIVSIEYGGIRQIKVIDNGSGVEKEYMREAFMPHATSKISSAEDLDSILTLGFRGEALASIAAVSRVSMTSKNPNEELGSYIEIEAGKILKMNDAGAKDGTTMIVSDLFFNVPARAKFLKKPKSEEQEVTALITKLMLANPNISFRYIVDDKTMFTSSGKSLKEAMFGIYGKEAISETLEVNVKRDGMTVTGYIGRPSYSKANRTYQTLIVNGRAIQDQTISTAVANAYGDMLMKRRYPFFVLNLTMPISDVDVNVHPNKKEVRFAYPNKIYSIFFEAVARALHEMDYVSSVEDKTLKNVDETVSESVFQSFNRSQNDNSEIVVEKREPVKVEQTVIVPLPQTHNKSQKIDKAGVNLNPFSRDFSKMTNEEIIDTKHKILSSVSIVNSENKVADGFGLANKLMDRLAQAVANNENVAPDYYAKGSRESVIAPEIKFVGKVLNTYLIVEMGEDVFFIDQHAAHERLLYEKLKKQYETTAIAQQPLLVPYILSVNSIESGILEDNLSAMQSIGFDICEFGNNSFKISAVPSVLSDINFDKFFAEFLRETKFNGSTVDLIRESLMQKACKSAVKGGDDLSLPEVKKLFENMSNEKIPLFCPHGRPIAVRITKTEIEKWFKRIV